MNDMRERINAIVQDESKTAALLAAGCVMPRFKVGQEVWCVAYSMDRGWHVLNGEVINFITKAVVPTPDRGNEVEIRHKHEKRGYLYHGTLEDYVYATFAEAQAAMEGK